MATQDVARGLVGLCRQGKNDEAITRYYGDDIVSVEAGDGAGGGPAEMRGIAAVQGKSQWWGENHEVHEMKVEGPFMNGDQFAVFFHMDVTHKPTEKRFQMDEVGVYTVEDNKVVHERFFYGD